MALTLEQAQTRLSSIATGDTEALKNLINELSIEASGSKTILYSGMGEDFSKNLSNNPDIRIIDNTQAFKFLKAVESPSSIQEEFKRILETDDFDRVTPANEFLYGIDGNPRTKGACHWGTGNFK
jgi:hypothetical protein